MIQDNYNSPSSFSCTHIELISPKARSYRAQFLSLLHICNSALMSAHNYNKYSYSMKNICRKAPSLGWRIENVYNSFLTSLLIFGVSLNELTIFRPLTTNWFF